MDAMLIIGGLFAIALLALIVLIFALRSAPRKKNTPTRSPASQLAQSQDTSTRSPASQLAHGQEDTAHKSDVKQQKEEDESSEVTEGRLPAIRNHTQLSSYGRQFQEFAIELHVLHRQVQDIEHRLGMLSQIMDRIEQVDNRRTTFIEEEPHSTQHPPQTQ